MRHQMSNIALPLMKGRHFVSPIRVNHWQTSSVFSSPRNFSCCLSMSWGDEGVTHLLLIPQPIWQSLSLITSSMSRRCTNKQHPFGLKIHGAIYHWIWCLFDWCLMYTLNPERAHGGEREKFADRKEGGTWRTEMIQSQLEAWEKLFWW